MERTAGETKKMDGGGTDDRQMNTGHYVAIEGLVSVSWVSLFITFSS